MVFGTLALLSHLSIVAFQVSRAATLKGTKSCKTQGESVRPYDCNLTSIQMNARASQRLALSSKRLAWASQAHAWTKLCNILNGLTINTRYILGKLRPIIMTAVVR